MKIYWSYLHPLVTQGDLSCSSLQLYKQTVWQTTTDVR